MTTQPYDWAGDPLATARPLAPVAARPTGQLYRTVHVVPAVVARFQPRLERPWRIDRRPGLVQVQWRWPRREDFFPRN